MLPKVKSFAWILIIALLPVTGKAQPFMESIASKIGLIQFNKSSTRFQFAKNLNGRILYSPNGARDISNPTATTGFYLEAFHNMDYDAAAAYVQQLTLVIGKSNPAKTTASLKNSIINVQGNKAFCAFFDVYNSNSQTSSVFIGVISYPNKKALLFVGNDFSKGSYVQAFFKTFQSLHLLSTYELLI